MCVFNANSQRNPATPATARRPAKEIPFEHISVVVLVVATPAEIKKFGRLKIRRIRFKTATRATVDQQLVRPA